MSYLRPATGMVWRRFWRIELFSLLLTGEYVVARAEVARAGKALSVVRVDVCDDQGRLCVTGKILYSVGGKMELPPSEIPKEREGSQYTAFGAAPKL